LFGVRARMADEKEPEQRQQQTEEEQGGGGGNPYFGDTFCTTHLMGVKADGKEWTHLLHSTEPVLTDDHRAADACPFWFLVNMHKDRYASVKGHITQQNIRNLWTILGDYRNSELFVREEWWVVGGAKIEYIMPRNRTIPVLHSEEERANEVALWDELSDFASQHSLSPPNLSE
jgi:hypothetical protein